ncbi:MAG: hypothetical protein GAK37_00914 [Pseudomonas sp.]|nr:MAG: hypothetical protein GAK37_00914 [Pseudomonas sp.]
MSKALRNPLFLIGLPMLVCGFAIAAPGLWIPGMALAVCGLSKK